MPDAEGRVCVAILAYPEVTASVVYAMHDLLSAAGRDWAFITTGVPGPQRMRPYVVSARLGEVLTANGDWIRTEYGFDDCPRPDIVCVPDFTLPPDDPCVGRFDTEVEWLRNRYRAGATLACTCTGAVMLAQTGLLDGMDATIHWNYAPSLAKHYLRLKVDPDKALVVTGAEQRIVMAGGGTSHLDLILYLIARFVGLTEALEVAKAYLIMWHDEGQRPFTSLLTGKQTSDALIGKCQEWAADHYAEATPVAAMMRLSGLSERTFVRRFTRATGMSTSTRFDSKRQSRFWKPRICCRAGGGLSRQRILRSDVPAADWHDARPVSQEVRQFAFLAEGVEAATQATS